MPTVTDVANWMVDELQKEGTLSYHQIVKRVHSIFGRKFVFINPDGNFDLIPEVRSEFENLTAGTVLWDETTRQWKHLSGETQRQRG